MREIRVAMRGVSEVCYDLRRDDPSARRPGERDRRVTGIGLRPTIEGVDRP